MVAISQIRRNIDIETLLKVGSDSRLLRSQDFEGIRLADDGNEIIFNAVKAFMKSKFPRSRFRANNTGCSISLNFPAEFDEMYRFGISMGDILDAQLNTFRGYFRDVLAGGNNNRYAETLFGVTIRHCDFNFQNDRILMYIQYRNPTFYSRKTTFSAITEIIYFFDAVKNFYETRFQEYRTRYVELHEHEERERRARQARELEERERQERERQERQRREQREREQRIQREQREREEAARLAEAERLANDAEQQRIQELMSQGATAGGAEIALRLQALLQGSH